MSLSDASEPRSPAPVTGAERIVSLDVLRGVAVLGILIMNVQSFAMPAAAYFNPTAFGDLDGADYWVWALSHLFADQKFMTIFSMLFGAGIVLFSDRVEARGGRPLWLHYRRAFWLLVIGLGHAYLIWSGDILVAYAICSFVAYWFRRRSPRMLVAAGLLAFTVPAAFVAFGGASMEHWPPATRQMLQSDWRPSEQEVAAEIQGYQGSWLEQQALRTQQSLEMHMFALPFWALWRAGGLMLAGMALYKWGVLSAKRSQRFYAALAVVGVGVGGPIVVYGVIQNQAHAWEFLYSRYGMGFQYNYWGSPLISLAYVALVMLFVQWGGLERLQRALAAVGRTALTNYLAQSVITTFVFYGFGLGLFGELSRADQLAIVFAVWVAQIVVSPLWLQRFRFGPAEWLWRSLTYWRLQPLTRQG